MSSTEKGFTLKKIKGNFCAQKSKKINIVIKNVCKKLSDLENEIYRVQLGVFLTKFGHKLLLYLLGLTICERIGKNKVPKEYCYSKNGNLTNGKLKSPLALELVANFPLSMQIYQSKSEADVLDSVFVILEKYLPSPICSSFLASGIGFVSFCPTLNQYLQ